MTTKHTQGTMHTAGTKVFSHDHYLIAECSQAQGMEDGQAERYAALFAAAPELLRKLKDLLAMVERQTDFNDDGDGNMIASCHELLSEAQS